VTLLAFAAGRVLRRHAAGRYPIDRYPAGPTAANLPHPLLLSNDGTDRQTDGRTAGSCLDLVPHTMRVPAGGVNTLGEVTSQSLWSR